MLDQLFDLFDRDRRSRRTGAGQGGLKGMLARLTGEDPDHGRRHPDDSGRRDARRREDSARHDDWDDDAFGRPGSGRGRRDGFELDD